MSRDPFVVSAMSMGISESMRTSVGRPARNVGSPPVSRNFWTPRCAKIRATRAISSKVKISLRGRNSKSRPKTSRGMQ